MPLYDMVCPKCDFEMEAISHREETMCPDCGTPMAKKFPGNIMVKMKGEGGYPSRHRQVFNTTMRKHPPLEHERNAKTF